MKAKDVGSWDGKTNKGFNMMKGQRFGIGETYSSLVLGVDSELKLTILGFDEKGECVINESGTLASVEPKKEKWVGGQIGGGCIRFQLRRDDLFAARIRQTTLPLGVHTIACVLERTAPKGGFYLVDEAYVRGVFLDEEKVLKEAEPNILQARCVFSKHPPVGAYESSDESDFDEDDDADEKALLELKNTKHVLMCSLHRDETNPFSWSIQCWSTPLKAKVVETVKTLCVPKEWTLTADNLTKSRDWTKKKWTMLDQTIRGLETQKSLFPKKVPGMVRDPDVIKFAMKIRMSGLPSMDNNGFSDPFFKIKCGKDSKYKSEVKKRTLDPTFKNFVWKVPELTVTSKFFRPSIEIAVWDWDRLSSNDYIGLVLFPQEPLVDEILASYGRPVDPDLPPKTWKFPIIYLPPSGKELKDKMMDKKIKLKTEHGELEILKWEEVRTKKGEVYNPKLRDIERKVTALKKFSRDELVPMMKRVDKRHKKLKKKK